MPIPQKNSGAKKQNFLVSESEILREKSCVRDDPILNIPKQVEMATLMSELYGEHGMSSAISHKWRTKESV